MMLHCALSVAMIGLFVADDGAAPAKVDEGLRLELRQMVKDDQDARMKLVNRMKEPDPADAEGAKQLTETLAALDRKHTARLKEIVDKQGWPGTSLVGMDGAQNAWLLVQHADHDREFQKRCLKLLEEAAKKGEASKQNLAYLTDRVLVGEGKKQLYGTQFKEEKGEMIPQPIDDEANVDKRRAEVGLSTLAEYKKLIDEMYKPKAKAKQ